MGHWLSAATIAFLLSAPAYGENTAPKPPERPKPASTTSLDDGLDDKAIADRLTASPVRALQNGSGVKLPASPRGHEIEIFKSVQLRPSFLVDVKFKGASDVMAADPHNRIAKLAAALGDRRLVNKRILIGAQTNLLGSDAYNAEVAGLRAKAIANTLAKRFGINAARLETVGFGRLKDADSGSTIRFVNLGAFEGKTEAKAANAAMPSASTAKRAPRAHAATAFAVPGERKTRRLGETNAWQNPYALGGQGPNASAPSTDRLYVRAGGAGAGGAGAGGAGAGGAGAGGAGSGGAGAGGAGAGGAGAGGAGAGGAGAGGAGAGGAGGGGAGGSGAGSGGARSDRRLKRNIVRLGETAAGIPLYRFEYIWGGPVYVGVMAQDIAILRPDALIEDGSGFYSVDYEKLGLRMLTLADYERGVGFEIA